MAVVALTAKNLTRSRAGRAMQAVRDRDAAAEAIGISLARTKVLAFVVSSSLAAMAGALFGSYQQFVSPSDFGAVRLAPVHRHDRRRRRRHDVRPHPRRPLHHRRAPVIEEFSDRIPGVASGPGAKGITVFSLNQALFGVLIIAFLLLEPRGLAALWLRIKAYFRAWPFSY